MFYDRLSPGVKALLLLLLTMLALLAFTDRLQGWGNIVFDILLLALFVDIVILKRINKRKK